MSRVVDGKVQTLYVKVPPFSIHTSTHYSIMDSIEGVAVWILLELLVIFLGMVASCSTTFTCMRRICEGEFKLRIECLGNI